MKNLARVTLIILGSLFALLVIAISGVCIAAYRLEPPDTSDLERLPTKYPDSENLFFDLMDSIVKLNLNKNESDAILKPTNRLNMNVKKRHIPEKADLVSAIHKNSDVMLQMETAINKPVYRVPDSWLKSTVTPYEQKQEEKTIYDVDSATVVIARLFNSRATLALEERDFDKAIPDLFLELDLGKKIRNETLISMMIASAVHEIACDTLRKMTLLDDIPKPVLLRAIRKLEEYNKPAPICDNCAKTEFFITSYMMEYAKNNGDGNGVIEHDPEMFLINFDGFYNQYMHKLATINREVQKNFHLPYTEIVKRKYDKIITTNSFLDLFTDMLSVEGLAKAYNHYIVKHLSTQFTIRATALTLALKAYKQDTGQLPESLESLIPEYISEIPKDPFDDKDIRYSKEKKLIWSIGQDLVDTNGEKPESYSWDEPRVEIEL